MALDNFLTNRDTESRTGNFASMQAFEHSEYPVGVLRIDSDPVVAHRKAPAFRITLRRNMNPRGFLAPVLDRIGDKVLKKLHRQDRFGDHGGQWIGGYH